MSMPPRGRLRARTLASAAGACAAALVLTACGGSDEGSGGASSNGSDTAAGLTGTPIKVVVSSGIDTPLGSYNGDFAAAEAAAAEINAAGGVNGQPIEIITCNNRIEPNASAQCAQEAVSQQAAAITGTDLYGSSNYPALTAADVVASYIPLNFPDYSADNHPVAGGGIGEMLGGGVAAAEAGAKSVTFVNLDTPGVDQLIANETAVAEKQGLTVKDVIRLSLTTTNFSTALQQMKDSGADAVVLQTSGPQVASILQAAQQLNFDPIWVSDYSVFNSDVLDTVAKFPTANIHLVSTLPPLTDTDNPGIAAYTEAVDALEESGDSDADPKWRNENAVYVWTFVHALAEVARTTEGEATSESIAAAMTSPDTSVDVPGLLTAWKPGTPGSSSQYPTLMDDLPVYHGPLTDGVYEASAEPVPAVEGVTLQ